MISEELVALRNQKEMYLIKDDKAVLEMSNKVVPKTIKLNPIHNVR